MKEDEKMIRWNGMLIPSDSPCLQVSKDYIDNSNYVNCDDAFCPEEFQESYFDTRGLVD
jgi:hypothetical protein